MPASNEELAAMRAPAGFKWSRRPTVARAGILRMDEVAFPTMTPTVLNGVMLSFAEWAYTSRVGVSPHDKQQVTLRNGTVLNLWTKWRVSPGKPSVTKKYLGNPGGRGEEAHWCAGCHREKAPGLLFCDYCGFYSTCQSCDTSGVRLVATPNQEQGINEYCCINCIKQCTVRGCERVVVDGNPKCRTHDPRDYCTHCRGEFRVPDLEEHIIAAGQEARRFCKGCVEQYFCPVCGLYGHPITGQGENRKCQICREGEEDAVRIRLEQFAPEDVPATLHIPALPERPTRTVSIEIEYNSVDPAKVARTLFREGLIEHPTVGNYTMQGRAEYPYPCILKSDGSVTGGELVAFMMNLDDERHATSLMRVLEVMNGLKGQGLVEYGVRAGGHIHHDAHNMSVGDGYALVTIFNYLEDTIYRIAGAGDEATNWLHRSLHGNNYAGAGVIKGPFGSKREFGSRMATSGRAALNIQHFVAASRACTCGARQYEAWADCTCTLPKNTIEWRVFNATGNPRVMHGWLALMLSMVSYATNIEINEADFPRFDWTAQPFARLTAAQKTETKERLRWIFTHLPMTQPEKASLVYVIKKSELLGLGEAFIDGLAELEALVDWDVKPIPRNPNRRTIAIRKPARGVVPPFRRRPR